MSIYAIDR